MRVVVSEGSAYCELNDAQEAFGGEVGERIKRRFVMGEEAIESLGKAVEASMTASFGNTKRIAKIVPYP